MTFQDKSQKEIQTWIDDFLKETDSLTTGYIPRIYAKEGSIVFGNNAPVVGVADIIAYYESNFHLLKSMKHTLHHYDVNQNKLYLTLTIDYTVNKDPENKEIPIPALAVFDFVGEGDEKGKLVKLQVYYDLAPVFGRIGEITSGGK